LQFIGGIRRVGHMNATFRSCKITCLPPWKWFAQLSLLLAVGGVVFHCREAAIGEPA
jgi:hypothetical protein